MPFLIRNSTDLQQIDILARLQKKMWTADDFSNQIGCHCTCRHCCCWWCYHRTVSESFSHLFALAIFKFKIWWFLFLLIVYNGRPCAVILFCGLYLEKILFSHAPAHGLATHIHLIFNFGVFPSMQLTMLDQPHKTRNTVFLFGVLLQLIAPLSFGSVGRVPTISICVWGVESCEPVGYFLVPQNFNFGRLVNALN